MSAEEASKFVNGRKQTMFSKNVSFVVLVGVELAPMFAFAGLRLGFFAVAAGFVEAALLALAYMTWGNLVAVNHRFKMEFFRFTSGGSPIDALVGVVFGSLPGAIAIQLFHQNYWWLSLLMLMLYVSLYWLSLTWSGKTLDRKSL
jgi:hypothetical protein